MQFNNCDSAFHFTATMETCVNPGCDQPGTNKCSGCKTTPYCGPICQKAHWPEHKEVCDGHLRKVGMAHLDKAGGFYREQNWPQTLRYSELAATKLMQLKNRPVEDISFALGWKCTALEFFGQSKVQMECAKEWYCMWNTKPTDVGAIEAAFALIGSCMANKEYVDAKLYASTIFEIINHKHDNKIPEDDRQYYIARGAYFLARATLRLAVDGGIPPDEKQKAKQEAIALARRALEIHTQLHGTEHDDVANDMLVLAESLHAVVDDDDEALHLFQQAKSIYARTQGSSSVNVAVCEERLGRAFHNIAAKSYDTNDLDRCVANLELALPYFREADRIYRAASRIGNADTNAQLAGEVEKGLGRFIVVRVPATATTSSSTTSATSAPSSATKG